MARLVLLRSIGLGHNAYPHLNKRRTPRNSISKPGRISRNRQALHSPWTLDERALLRVDNTLKVTRKGLQPDIRSMPRDRPISRRCHRDRVGRTCRSLQAREASTGGVR
jgi:hypothetical protein